MSDLPDLFPGFESRTIRTGGAEIFVRLGGEGPPLLLLHGYPQTHHAWHRLAPELVKHFTLVVADLRGYGQSLAPASDDEHYAYSKRAMGIDTFEVMDELGHQHFMGHCHVSWRGPRLAEVRVRSRGRGHLTPLVEGFAAEPLERGAGDQVALDVEEVVDAGVQGKKPLRGAW